jgi:hypothetical protein
MDHPSTTTAGSLPSLFPHDRGPTDSPRAVPVGELRAWPAQWSADPRVLSAIADAGLGDTVRRHPDRLRYFAAFDPAFPRVPLLRANSGEASPARDPSDPRLPPGTSPRDKPWQRLVVEDLGPLPQPGFAAVTGNRVAASNAPWQARVESADCRPAAADLRSASRPGGVIVLEGADAGFAAVVGGDGVRVVSRNPHVATLLGGAADHVIPLHQWHQFVAGLCTRPLPLGVVEAAFDPAADLADALRACPGSYVLKPRYGSNGVGVVRVVARPDGRLTAESDCPDTALYLEEFPCDPRLRGRDLLQAAATHRRRFLDRATAGLPERAADHSILEEEIRQDRADGSVFEPRVVVQRVAAGSGGSFASLGAICKRVDTPVGASVARGFREEPLEASLRRFLAPRVPPADLADHVRRTHAELLDAGDRLRAAVVPPVEARGVRVHQIGIDCRLCWNPMTGRAEFPFLEFQLGIGRVDWAEVGVPAFAGYATPEHLRLRFGPEVG